MHFDQSLAEKFLKIYSIPVEENWSEYLQNDYLNYFEYMVHLDIAGTQGFKIDDTSTYNLRMNPGLKSYLSKYYHYFDCGKLSGKVVMDVGCGWGFLSFWFLLCGAKEVDAVGFPYQIAFINRLRDAAKSRGLIPSDGKLVGVEKPLEKGNKDVGGLGASHADLIAYVEVYEHIPDDIFDDAMTASFNTLKPGGKMIGICHNTDNPDVMKRIGEYWDKLERDSFLEQRQKMISEKIPAISGHDLSELTRLTRGMMMKEFNDSIDAFVKNGKLPAAPVRPRPAVSLTYDYICENYISPPQVLKSMRKAGFKAFCYPCIRHSRRYMPFWPIEKVFNGALMKWDYLSATAVYVGTK